MKQLFALLLLLTSISYCQLNMADVSGMLNDQRVWNASLLAGNKEFSEIQLGALTIGTNVFTTTAAVDTVVITGTTTTDIFIISGKYVAGVDQQDVLQWRAVTDTLFVTRLAAGESAGAYSWLRIKTE